MIVYVYYCTAGTPYEDEAAELEVTLRQMGLFGERVTVPNLGDWCLNCSQKPSAIRQAMMKYEHKAAGFVYLDADARVRQYPTLFGTFGRDVDFACHYLDGDELMSGTLYFGNTPGAWDLVRKWQDGCKRAPNVWDQKILQKVVGDDHLGWSIDYLPEEYCYVFDSGRLRENEVVIEHLQRSRKHKQKISD